MRIAKALACLAFLVFLPALSSAGRIDSQLAEKLLSQSGHNSLYRVILVMAEQADMYALDNQLTAQKATLAQRHYQVITALHEIATQTQPAVIPLIKRLEASGDILSYKTFWLANLIAFEGNATAIHSLAALADVGAIYSDLPISLIEPIIESKPAPDHLIASRESSLGQIHAPEAWALGYTGFGRVVANLDTGVDGAHPAFAARFRGDVDGDGDYSESWYDPYNTHWTYPTDAGIHGTHTMGTICGRTIVGDTIGVAIDAKWIAAACIDRGGGLSRTISDALLAFQWIADPDGNPNTQDNPDACGNSWGIPDGFGYADCDQTFWVAIDNCEAAGTVVVFSAGNEGSSGLRSPADRATTYYNCFSVGAVDGGNPNLPIAPFSSLGPSECATGNMAIKPEVVAPGVNVRSSIPGGGYQIMSGTSMASPHITGAVAVIRQVNPNLSANTIKQILIQSSIDLGVQGEDNTYGNGVINLYQAVLLAMGFGGVDGYVRDESTNNPIPAKISVIGAPIQINAGISGYYFLGLKADTNYTIQASHYGYIPAQQTAAIVVNDTIHKNFALAAAPGAILQGTISIYGGGFVEGAEVTIINTPLAPDTTDANGFYQFLTVPSGTNYHVQVKASGYSQGDDSIYIQNGLTNIANFSLWPLESFDKSDGGYHGNSVWQWGIPTYGPPTAYSGVKCWATILNGAYPNSADDTLKSPQYFISSPSASLQFYQWYEFEDHFDGGNIRISSDGGLSWNLLMPQGNYPDPHITGLGNEPGYTHSSAGWVRAYFDLSPYHNRDVIIAWRFGSDFSITKAGWYIDDVMIIGGLPPPPPALSYAPGSFSLIAQPGQSESRVFHLNNSGNGPLNYTITSSAFNLRRKKQSEKIQPIGFIKPDGKKLGELPAPYFPTLNANHGGPDIYGHIWRDSDDQGGPLFNWADISSIGNLVSMNDDDYDGPFPIGFSFPFFDSVHSELYIGSNGLISFGSGSSSNANTNLPNSVVPNDQIAIWWDDINPADNGEIYYYSDTENSRFIVSYSEIPNYRYPGGTGSFTFQAILYPTGKIVFQYQLMNPGIDPDSLHGATIGIENASGTDGLQVVHNANYVHNELAVAISKTWLNVTPNTGTVAAHDTFDATVVFDASELGEGIYTGNINLQSNDPTNPNVNIPVDILIRPQQIASISLSDSSISDTLIAGTIENISLFITNIGNQMLSYIITGDQAWIAANSAGDSALPGEIDTINIAINTIGLTPGGHSGQLTISSNDPSNNLIHIPVFIWVEAGNNCVYISGDINGDGSALGGDITYGVRYFKGFGMAPPDSCMDDSLQQWLYAAGDVNGNCEFRGSDITYLVSFFKGINASLFSCYRTPSRIGPILKPQHPKQVRPDTEVKD